jgi:hypothetical protein
MGRWQVTCTRTMSDSSSLSLSTSYETRKANQLECTLIPTARRAIFRCDEDHSIPGATGSETSCSDVWSVCSDFFKHGFFSIGSQDR